MANLPSSLTKEAGEQLYQALLDAVQQQLEQQAPHAFTFRRKSTKPSEQAVSDLIVQPVGADGYCQIFMDCSATREGRSCINSFLRVR